jgi:hypothetical protein
MLDSAIAGISPAVEGVRFAKDVYGATLSRIAQKWLPVLQRQAAQIDGQPRFGVWQNR